MVLSVGDRLDRTVVWIKVFGLGFSERQDGLATGRQVGQALGDSTQAPRELVGIFAGLDGGWAGGEDGLRALGTDGFDRR